MTDSYQEQVSLFSVGPEKEIEVKAPPISAFAAEQDEISRWLFDATPIGTYAQERIDRELKEAVAPEELHKILRATGPGYERFRLYERYFELRNQRKDQQEE